MKKDSAQVRAFEAGQDKWEMKLNLIGFCECNILGVLKKDVKSPELGFKEL